MHWEEGPVHRILVRRTVRVEAVDGTDRIRIRALRVPTVPGQAVVSEDWWPLPTGSGAEQAGSWKEWDLPSRPGVTEYVYQAVVDVVERHLTAAPLPYGDEADPWRWTRPDSQRPSDAPAICELAATLSGDYPLEFLESAWCEILSRMRYLGFDRVDKGVLEGMQRGGGDCTEFSDLFTALARARGIPARSVRGWVLRDPTTLRHQWSEVWLPRRGWTAFDPTWGASRSADFERIPGGRVVLAWDPPTDAMGKQDYEAWWWWGSPPAITERDSVSQLFYR